MASYLALKRLMSLDLRSSSLLLRPVTTVRGVAQPLSSRLFNTNAAREYDSYDCNPAVGRGYGFHLCSPFSVEAIDPLSPRSMSQILNVIDLFKGSPVASGVPRDCEVRVMGDALHLRIDMPGLGKKDVKVSVEQSTLIIKGEGEKEFEDDESGRRHTVRIGLPQNLYKTNEIKAEMKNGVLKVLIPKIKEEEMSDVFHVQVE